MAHPILRDIGTAVAHVGDAILAGGLDPPETSQPEDDADRRADALADASTQLQHEASVQVARINKRINQLRRISKLPLEILLAIVHLAVKLAPGRNRHLRVLCTVTTAWWQAIDSDPRLWSFISPGDLPRLAIRRSSNVPLTIHWPEEITRYNGGALGRPFAESIITHRDRWRIVCLRDPAIINAFRPALQRSLLTLEEVQLTVKKRNRISDTVDLSGGPRLRKVAVSRVALRWDCEALSGLRHLSIQNVFTGPSLSQIIHVLSACTDIELLRLESIHSTPAAPLADDFGQLDLRHLKRLTVSDCIWMSELLCRLRAESLMEVAVLEREETLVHWGYPQGSTFAWMTQPDAGFHHLLRSAAKNGGVQHLSCHITGNFLSLWGKRGPEVPMKLTVAMESWDWPEVFPITLPALLPFVTGDIPIHLHLSNPFNLGASSFPYTCLAGMPAIVALYLSQNTLTYDIIRFLSEPQVLSDGSTRWPCPRLSIIMVEESPDPVAAVARMIRKRRQATRELGAALEEMIVCNWNYQVLDEDTYGFEYCGTSEWLIEHVDPELAGLRELLAQDD